MKKSNRVKFNLQEQLRKALDYLLEHRYERLDGSKWFSASDLERRVRAAADELLMGVPYGEYGTSACYGARIMGLKGISLLQHCRRFLFDKVSDGELDCNNPGRGDRCSTGMRFRPAGEGLSEAEKRNAEKPERPRFLSHLKHVEIKQGSNGNSYEVKMPECEKNKQKKGYVFRPKMKWYSEDNPTCKKCQKILEIRKREEAEHKALLESIRGE